MDYYELFFTLIVSLFVVLTIMTLIWHINYNKSVKSSRCYRPSTTKDRISLVAKDKYENSSLINTSSYSHASVELESSCDKRERITCNVVLGNTCKLIQIYRL